MGMRGRRTLLTRSASVSSERGVGEKSAQTCNFQRNGNAAVSVTHMVRGEEKFLLTPLRCCLRHSIMGGFEIEFAVTQS